MKEFNAVALFRLSVLGPLVSPERLERGELQTIIRGLASKEYAIPGSDRRFLGEKTIEAWYYAGRAHGIDGLISRQRTDRGVSKLPLAVQEALLAAKRENPRRSIRQLKILLDYRRAQLWHDLKARIQELADNKQLLLVGIIDEAQNLPPEFFREFPAFLNLAFDSRELMTVWLVGHPSLANTLNRAPYAALAGRIQVRLQLMPVIERERIAELINYALKAVGCQHTLLADSGMELLRQASQGLPRQAGRIMKTAMQMAVPKGLNHLPDDCCNKPLRPYDDHRYGYWNTVPGKAFRRSPQRHQRCSPGDSHAVGKQTLPPAGTISEATRD